MRYRATILAITVLLSACAAEKPDGCKSHTGDGICVDNSNAGAGL